MRIEDDYAIWWWVNDTIRTTLDKIESGGLTYLSPVDIESILSSTGWRLDHWPEIVPQFPPGMIAALPDGSSPIDLPTRKRKAWLIARLETLDRVKFYNDRRTFWRSLSSDNKDGLVQLVYSNTIQSLCNHYSRSFDINMFHHHSSTVARGYVWV